MIFEYQFFLKLDLICNWIIFNLRTNCCKERWRLGSHDGVGADATIQGVLRQEDTHPKNQWATPINKITNWSLPCINCTQQIFWMGISLVVPPLYISCSVVFWSIFSDLQIPEQTVDLLLNANLKFKRERETETEGVEYWEVVFSINWKLIMEEETKQGTCYCSNWWDNNNNWFRFCICNELLKGCGFIWIVSSPDLLDY